MIISVEATTKKAEKSLGKVEKKLGKVAGQEKQVTVGTTAMAGGFAAAGGAATAMTGGALAGLTAVKTSLMTAVGGLKIFKSALAATGVGLLVVAIGTLVTFFTKTKKGAEMLEVATAAMGAVFGKLIDGVSFLGGLLVNLFTSPMDAIKGFGKFLKEFVMDRVTNLMDGLGFLGSAISKLFKGDFSGAMADAKKGVTNLAMANPLIAATAMIAKKVADGAIEMAKELSSAARQAASLARRSIALREAQRELNVQFAEGRAQIREYQIISEDTTKTIEERIAASEAAGAIEAELLLERQRIAQEELDIHNQNMGITESLEEDYDKRNDLEVALIDLRTQSARIQKSILMKTQILRKEEEANVKAHNKALADAEEALQKRLDKLAIKVADAILSQEQRELQKVAMKYMSLMQGLEFHSEEFQILMKKQGDEEQAIRDKYDKVTIDSDAKVLKTKYDMANQALGALSALSAAFASDDEEGAKRAFQRNKAISMASAVMNTYQAVTGALAEVSLVPGERFIKAAAAGAMGLAQVVGIQKTKFKSSTTPTAPDSNSLSGGGGGISAATSQAPPSIDFGFLGQGAGGGIQAYVIAENVSNGLQAEQKLNDQVVL